MELPPADLLEQTMRRELPCLAAITEAEAEAGAARPGTWSRKEELGHLLDSAANNHIRFVRAALEDRSTSPGYDQTAWVRLHGYAALPFADLVELWRRYNALLVHLLRRIPAERFAATCAVGGTEATLDSLTRDYVAHMQHHLDHILGR